MYRVKPYRFYIVQNLYPKAGPDVEVASEMESSAAVGTLKLTPYTRHLTPYTLHPTLYTLHHTPYTLHPTP